MVVLEKKLGCQFWIFDGFLDPNILFTWWEVRKQVFGPTWRLCPLVFDGTKRWFFTLPFCNCDWQKSLPVCRGQHGTTLLEDPPRTSKSAKTSRVMLLMNQLPSATLHPWWWWSAWCQCCWWTHVWSFKHFYFRICICVFVYLLISHLNDWYHWIPCF